MSRETLPIVHDDGKRFFEAVESWTTGRGSRGRGGRLVGLICRISRRIKTAKIWVSCPSVSLAAFFVQRNQCFTMLLRGAFCVALARFACLFFANSGQKKDGYFSASPCLLTACVFRAWTCLGDAGDAGDAGGAGGSASTRDAGDAGKLGMLMLIFCSRSLCRGAPLH